MIRSDDPAEIKQSILAELDAAKTAFHAMLDSMGEEDFLRLSLNPGWTNGEIMVHITFGFIVLNVLLPMARLWGKLPRSSSRWFADLLNWLTRPFNWINGLGARFQGKVFTYPRVGKTFDRYYNSLLKKAGSIHADEWDHGMYYPAKWDPNFSDFMTLEKLFRYVVAHTRFHLAQISPG